MNPFAVTKAEGFNHSYENLALLMQFKVGVADVLLSNTNVFIEGSRGSGKSMYLRLLSLPVKEKYEELANAGKVEPLPGHQPYVGVYTKLSPTVFGPHEFEAEPGFRELFQQLFNIYCAEHLVKALLEAGFETKLSAGERTEFSSNVSDVLLPREIRADDLGQLYTTLRRERRRIREALNRPPYAPDSRSQPDTLWEVAEAMTRVDDFKRRRVHLLLDEFDALTEVQQRTINSYLRKRDFPLTFKIACKKHRLNLVDLEGRPLNPSGDFDPVQLDDDDFGLSGTFPTYLASIANKRFQVAGIEADIRSFLGKVGRRPRPRAAPQYAGFEIVATLSSGIVRTFLELCRDMYGRAQFDQRGRPHPIEAAEQHRVIEEHAQNRWNALARDKSARPELQLLIDRIAEFFKTKMETSKERQIIRLEIVNADRLSPFLQSLLDQALEYEALAQPNRERLQKNQAALSRGYLLNRLLCVHFRFEPSSRWDAEISAEQLERLLFGGREIVREIAKAPTKRPVMKARGSSEQGGLFEQTQCPILDAACPAPVESRGVGFLACRLPEGGHIRDAIRLIKEGFGRVGLAGGGHYKILTGKDYPTQGDVACKICYALSRSEFLLAEMSRLSPSVAMELGMAIARRMPAFILFNSDEQREVPEPFASLEYLRYPITREGVRALVEEKLVPFLSDAEGGGGKIRLGPQDDAARTDEAGVFLALPGTPYHQETILPEIRSILEGAGLNPVKTEQDGQALQDLQRAALAIAASRFCLIDTTLGAPVRALYLGMAQGYRKPFANLVDRDRDPTGQVFTNARSKAELPYRDLAELKEDLRAFFGRFGVTL